MSTIDPTKSKPIAPTLTPTTAPPKAPEKKSTASPVDHEYTGPAPKFGPLFTPAAPPPATSSAPALTGPGVMATVFGPKFPNPSKMSDAELANGIEKLGTAIRKDPGKVNDADMKLWGAMISEAAGRTELRMGNMKPVGEMSNLEVFGQLLAFDAAEIAGKPLTTEQKARKQELEKTLETRSKYDIDGDIAYYQKVRAQAKSDMKLHCAAAGAGVISLATHNNIPAAMAAGAVIYAKATEGKKNAAILEGTLAAISLLPFAHKPAEITSTLLNAGECATATQEYFHAGHMIHQLEAEKKAQEAKAK